MKNNLQSLLVITVLLTFSYAGFAQGKKEFLPKLDSIEAMLPPLQTIIDSAIARNPYVRFRDLQVTINKDQLKSSKHDWTKDLGFQSDILYGNFDNFSTNISQNQNTALYSTRSTQFNYGVGAFVRLPLNDFINRRNQNRLARAAIEQAQSYSLEQRTELRQVIIKQYNELITKYRLLKIKMKYAQTARINLDMAQKQFLNGTISVADFASINEIFSRSEADLESTKMDFRTAYMLLEEIVGIKFKFADK